MKRLLSALLALAMLASLCACGNDQATAPAESTSDPLLESTEASVETEATPKQLIDIIVDGTSKYRIVYPKGASETLTAAVGTVCDTIGCVTGVVPETTIDLITSVESGNLSMKRKF